MEKVRVLVLIKKQDQDEEATEKIASSLSAAGLEISQIYPVYRNNRYIAGLIEPEKIAVLKEIQGVESAERDGNPYAG